MSNDNCLSGLKAKSWNSTAPTVYLVIEIDNLEDTQRQTIRAIYTAPEEAKKARLFLLKRELCAKSIIIIEMVTCNHIFAKEHTRRYL